MRMSVKEKMYLAYRKLKGILYSFLFYMCRIFKIKKYKIVVSCFYGEMGYGCSPKYIIEELEKHEPGKYEIIWLVNDTARVFPSYVRPVRNNCYHSAYHLSTAKIWVDNDKKPLGVKKRKGQYYINTWHGPIGFKTVGLLRGENYSEIARLISKKDCEMTDLYLSNSKWCTDTHLSAYPYSRDIVLEKGMPRTDPILNDAQRCKSVICKRFRIPEDANIVIYAPTFRGGLQKTKLGYESAHMTLDMERVLRDLEKKFNKKWYMFLRLHPKVAAHIGDSEVSLGQGIIDVSQEDDLYEIIAASDALITDLSSCAFDASYKRIPVFLYIDDYDEFVSTRELYWKMDELPFPLSRSNDELSGDIDAFDEEKYKRGLASFFDKVELKEEGNASKNVAEIIRSVCG